ncbi:MAG: metal-dependent hydrolase [Syntrophorhabdus sp. PtaB.Bin047]|jgi:L-ascorbate metabolism protein UlaG (beta-lactamase superfamily)|nr:MAG: metal-dependent hydrolase [Syntrophorhabdus sp. PtaB.Bin047]
MKRNKRNVLSFVILSLVLALLLSLPACVTRSDIHVGKTQQASDHFDGTRYFNPGAPQALYSVSGQATKRGATWWVWKWIFRTGWPEWPEQTEFSPGPPPVTRAPEGSIRVTPVGHATFLIQMDGLNILTDPIWSERCSPVSWVGPERYSKPGIRFDDLPPVDVVLVSHNHYDHFDIPTLKGLAKKGTPRAVVPLGNSRLMRSTRIPAVDELDWWQSVRLSSEVTVTLVPAQHFSGRTLWDRDRTLWGGFVISGPSGNVYYSGDTGYGPHFHEIARRFSPIRVALLPIAPFRPQTDDTTPRHRSVVHMGPAEAVQAHIDLGEPRSIAAHFQVFRLGVEGFADAPDVLAASLKEHGLPADAFILPVFGRVIEIPIVLDASLSPPAGVYYPIGQIQGFVGGAPSLSHEALFPGQRLL